MTLPQEPFCLDPPAQGPARVVGCSLLDLPGIVHGFSTRQGRRTDDQDADLDFGPNAAPQQKREHVRCLSARIGFAADHLFTARQVHGSRVVLVRSPSTPEQLREVEADALVTDVVGTAVGVRTADCVPILIAHTKRPVVAAVHAGWRGLLSGVLESTVEKMVHDFECNSDSLVAAVGPAIEREAFEVSEEVAQAFDHLEGAVYQPNPVERPHVDLKAAVHQALQGLGVSHVAISPLCTYSHSELFFSHRRDGHQAGRHLNVIGLV